MVCLCVIVQLLYLDHAIDFIFSIGFQRTLQQEQRKHHKALEQKCIRGVTARCILKVSRKRIQLMKGILKGTMKDVSEDYHADYMYGRQT